MKPNCRGCEEELESAYWDQENLRLNLVDARITGIGYKGRHMYVMMVNDDGKVIVE